MEGSYRFGLPALMEKWREEDRRRERSKKTKKWKGKRAHFNSKEDEYKKQKPCRGSGGNMGF